MRFVTVQATKEPSGFNLDGIKMKKSADKFLPPDPDTVNQPPVAP